MSPVQRAAVAATPSFAAGVSLSATVDFQSWLTGRTYYIIYILILTEINPGQMHKGLNVTQKNQNLNANMWAQGIFKKNGRADSVPISSMSH